MSIAPQYSRIKGCEDYWIGTDSQVYSEKSKRFLKPTDTNGIFSVQLRKNGRGYTRKIHRLMAYAFLDAPEEKLDEYLKNNLTVCFVNGDSYDLRVENLRFSKNLVSNYRARILNALNKRC